MHTKTRFRKNLSKTEQPTELSDNVLALFNPYGLTRQFIRQLQYLQNRHKTLLGKDKKYGEPIERHLTFFIERAEDFNELRGIDRIFPRLNNKETQFDWPNNIHIRVSRLPDWMTPFGERIVPAQEVYDCLTQNAINRLLITYVSDSDSDSDSPIKTLFGLFRQVASNMDPPIPICLTDKPMPGIFRPMVEDAWFIVNPAAYDPIPPDEFRFDNHRAYEEQKERYMERRRRQNDT